MNVACVGGGPAGLYLAILLGRDGAHEITVLERNPPGVTYGWGVVFWEDLLDQLRAGDPETARAISATAFRWDGQRLAVEGREPVHIPGHGFGIGRRRLLEILAARAAALGVRVRFECEVDDVAELAAADLIVACDGISSRLREQRRDRFRTTVRAHTTHFTIGSGTTLALEDALGLAARLREGTELETALERYAGERRRALAPSQSDARFSAQWFENVPRYADLEPERFFALLRARRSPLLPRIPPPVYYRLHRATRNVATARRLRRWVAPRINAHYRP